MVQGGVGTQAGCCGPRGLVLTPLLTSVPREGRPLPAQMCSGLDRPAPTLAVPCDPSKSKILPPEPLEFGHCPLQPLGRSSGCPHPTPLPLSPTSQPLLWSSPCHAACTPSLGSLPTPSQSAERNRKPPHTSLPQARVPGALRSPCCGPLGPCHVRWDKGASGEEIST